ncbi:MAG: hypothetical protein JJT89_04845 [Nitriliruptoraceae bacterium]|nr:hypothetical protein [Nitriliruptoraceae bacterium]
MLIPSSWGFVPSLGMTEQVRAQLGGGLATGAAVAFALAAYEHRRREEDRRRRMAAAVAAVDASLNRLLNDLVVRYVRAVQIMEKEMRTRPNVRVGPGAEPGQWDAGFLCELWLKGVWLAPAMRPMQTPDDARVYLAFLHMMNSLLEGGSQVGLSSRVLSSVEEGAEILPTSPVVMLRAASEAASSAFTQLTSDADPEAHRYAQLQYELQAIGASPVGTSGPERAAMKIARLSLDHAHHDTVGSASTAAARARPAGVESGHHCWWQDPAALCRWVDNAARHLQAGGDASELLPAAVEVAPMTLGPVPGQPQ